ncbi:hypothetical protein [Burkholderia sp. BCC1047]|uniref:hypothetical protein n=1 Tax=Burkholderia sp. BCC1047 TaxID=2676299 RepID=UPI00158B3390|nr:hypothetical protein [Burkholderia sp. BCC1047]
MAKKDGRIVAAENETRVLRALHRFGWLRTRDVAALLWTPWQRHPAAQLDVGPVVASASGLRMAQYTLRRLADGRQALRGRGPDGSVLYALAEASARRLRQMAVPAVSGKDIVRSVSPAYFRHRTVANEIAIAAIAQGFRVSTEREIAQDRWVGGAAGIAGKKPDVLMNDRGRITWVEVEKSVKRKADFDRLVVWVAKVGNDTRQPSGSVLLGDGLRWDRLVFVCTPAFEGRLRRALAVAGWRPELLDAFVSFVTVLYSFEDISFA